MGAPHYTFSELYRWRTIFIVSVKFGRSHDVTKTALADPNDEAPFINWERIKVDVLPELSSFVRYLGILLPFGGLG